MRWVRWWDAARKDLGFALRQMSRRPAGSALAVTVLALGIGASTAVFSVVDGVVFSPLPFRAPERLVFLRELDPRDGSLDGVAPPTYQDWRDGSRTLEGLVAMSPGATDITGAGDPVHVPSAAVSGDFFRFLDVPLEAGRGFLPDEDRTGAPGVLVVSHRLWIDRFGGRADVVGSTVRLAGEPHRIVGVAPPGFDFPAGADAWTPLWQSWDQDARIRGAKVLQAVGRLAEGATPAGAEAELTALSARAPDADGYRASLTPLRRYLVGDVEGGLLLLLAAVTLVLIVACANVGNLLLTRALARCRELAVRASLGASRMRLATALLAESLTLAVFGGVLGTLAAWSALSALLRLAPADLPRANEIGVDGRVLLFAVGATILTGLLTGLVPALRAGGEDVAGTLRAADVRHGGDGKSGRVRNLLVVGQTALTLLLLAGAGLTGRSLLGLLARGAGFDASALVSVQLSLPSYRYEDPARVEAFRRSLAERLRSLPGVEGVAFTQNLPLAGRRMTSPLLRPGQEPGADPGPVAQIVAVSPGYFDVMGIRTLDGRGFSPEDGAREGVAVLSRSAARSYFDGESPVGREIRSFFQPEMLEVVGVVDDVRHGGLTTAPPPMLYVLLPDDAPWFHAVLRAPTRDQALYGAVRQVVAELDPRLPVLEMAPVSSLVRRSVARPRFLAELLGAFALVGLSVACLGLYAVVSAAVVQRHHEIGVRLALGAGQVRIRSLVLGRALRLAGAGTAVGLVLALLAGRFLEGMLYGVPAADPLTLGTVALLLLLASASAVVPTLRRAARIEPAEALRSE